MSPYALVQVVVGSPIPMEVEESLAYPLAGDCTRGVDVQGKGTCLRGRGWWPGADENGDGCGLRSLQQQQDRGMGVVGQSGPPLKRFAMGVQGAVECVGGGVQVGARFVSDPQGEAYSRVGDERPATSDRSCTAEPLGRRRHAVTLVTMATNAVGDNVAKAASVGCGSGQVTASRCYGESVHPCGMGRMGFALDEDKRVTGWDGCADMEMLVGEENVFVGNFHCMHWVGGCVSC